MNYTQIVAVNRICDKKNKFFNITELTEDEIIDIEKKYNDNKIWFTVKR